MKKIVLLGVLFSVASGVFAIEASSDSRKKNKVTLKKMKQLQRALGKNFITFVQDYDKEKFHTLKEYSEALDGVWDKSCQDVAGKPSSNRE